MTSLLRLLPVCLASALAAGGPEPALFKGEAAPLVRSLAEAHAALSPTPSLLAERARFRALEGRAPEAEQLIQDALAAGRGKGEVFRLCALAYLTLGDPSKAGALYDRLVLEAPKADDDFARAAVDLVAFGQIERAEALMALSYKLDPKDKDEVLPYAMALAEAGQTDLAVAWFGKVQGMDKTDARDNGWPLAQRLLGMGKVAEAGALVERILAVRPREWEYAVAVARAAVATGRKDLAATWMARAYQIGPQEPVLLTELAVLAQGKVLPYRR